MSHTLDLTSKSPHLFFWPGFQMKVNTTSSINTDTSCMYCFGYLALTHLSSTFHGHPFLYDVAYAGTKRESKQSFTQNLNDTTWSLPSRRDDLFLKQCDPNELSCGLPIFNTGPRDWGILLMSGVCCKKGARCKFPVNWKFCVLPVVPLLSLFQGSDVCVCRGLRSCSQKSLCYQEFLERVGNWEPLGNIASRTIGITLRQTYDFSGNFGSIHMIRGTRPCSAPVMKLPHMAVQRNEEKHVANLQFRSVNGSSTFVQRIWLPKCGEPLGSSKGIPLKPLLYVCKANRKW